MNKFALLLLFIAIAATVSYGQRSAAAARNSAVNEVSAAFDRLIEGITQVDAEKVMSVYDKSDRTLFFNNNGTATIGWETMRTNRESAYKRTKDVTLEITGKRIEILGPAAAYVSCKWKQRQVYDDKLEEASGRMTLIFKKIGKEWKVVHLHTSPDNPPASRPVLDSERQ